MFSGFFAEHSGNIQQYLLYYHYFLMMGSPCIIYGISMHEKFSVPVEKHGSQAERHPVHSVEEAASQVKAMREVCGEDPHAPECSPEMLHALVSETELADMYERIRVHQGITFHDIAETVARADRFVREGTDGYSEEELHEVGVRLKLLSTREEEIRKATRMYVRTLSQFFRTGSRRKLMGEDDFKAQYEQIDRRRRVAHNGLIESLRVYAQTLEWLRQEDLLDGATIYSWYPGQEIPQAESDQTILLTFSPRFLSDRELIQKWAVSVNLHDQIREIERLQDEEGHAL